MARQFISSVIVFAVVVGGWGCALAASLCPHAGCWASPRAAHDHQSAQRAETPESHEHHGATAEGGHAHGSSHEGHPLEATASARTSFSSDYIANLFNPHDGSCSHCMGRSESPQQRGTTEREALQFGRQGHAESPSVVGPRVLPEVSFAPDVLHSHGAPPGPGIHRHLLNSVFRI